MTRSAWVLGWWAVACAPTGPGNTDTLPPSVQDPTIVKTPLGAVGFYHTVVASMGRVVDQVAVELGIVTDELAALPMPVGASDSYTAQDSRQQLDDDGSLRLYAFLHALRAQAREARGFLGAYVSDSSAALRGHLYALEGYADVFLADVFCSGIPLSTVDFDADYTLAAGSTTAEVYTAAAALFDSALTLTGDSARLQRFAAVGRARALLALGRYADAAATVASVPTDFRYDVTFGGPSIASTMNTLLQTWVRGPAGGAPSMGDREGRNGLDYVSSGDPRTPVYVPDGTDQLGNMMSFPAKYSLSDPTTFVVADGIEARLIEAEASLAAGRADWLTILNTLRTDGTYDTQPDATDPNKVDTLWHAGSGGVAGLRPLADPSDRATQVDLVFRERAFWLYLTAHRQGDLRRLIRQYQRAPSAVYPSGAYPGGTGQYGSEITVPVPAREMQYNPNYTGCIDHNA